MKAFPVLRAYYKSSSVKQYEKGDRLLRPETCLHDSYHLAIARKLGNLSAINQTWPRRPTATARSKPNCSIPPWIVARWLRWPRR